MKSINEQIHMKSLQDFTLEKPMGCKNTEIDL